MRICRRRVPQAEIRRVPDPTELLESLQQIFFPTSGPGPHDWCLPFTCLPGVCHSPVMRAYLVSTIIRRMPHVYPSFIPFVCVYLVFVVLVMRSHSMSAIPLVPVSVSCSASVIPSVMCACLVSAILLVMHAFSGM